jgi:replicative DNA helicase
MNGSGQRDQALMLHVVKNRSGEKGQIAFDFFPSFSKFAEAG